MRPRTSPRHQASPGTSPGQPEVAATPDAAFTLTSFAHLKPKPPLDAQAVVLLAQSADDTFVRCAELALHTTRATTASVLLLRREPDVLEVVAAAGHLAQQARGQQLRRGEALGWRVIDSASTILIERAGLAPDAHFVTGRPVEGMYLGVPLVDPDGQVMGVLSVDTVGSSETLSEDDVQALLLLGQAAGVAYSRWQALDRAQRSARQLEQLARLSARVENLMNPADIAREGLRTLLDVSGFTAGATVSRDGQGRVSLSVLECGPAYRGMIEAALTRPRIPQGMVAEVLATNGSVAIPDFRASPVAPPEATTIRSALATPLRSGGQVVGVIGLMNLPERREIPAELVTLLEMVAARIDHALDRAAGLEHLHRTREAALRAMGRVIEGRDGETFGHTDRVTTLAVRLGEALGLGAASIQHLRWGAYLHDIGKVKVPDAILLKPGPLTPDERRVMQEHVVTGDDLLRDEIFVPREVRSVVRWHHERWDGAGYPDGLRGDDIPLLARIFSVVDVYDALVSERPYKRAWSPEAAVTELRRSAGTQFDPRIVAAFTALVQPEGQEA